MNNQVNRTILRSTKNYESCFSPNSLKNLHCFISVFFQSPATEPLIKSFWRIWSQDQLASKVFPVIMASRSVHRVGPFLYSPRPLGPSLDPNLAGLTHVPIKEGLQSIIKCLKAQDLNATGALSDHSSKIIFHCRISYQCEAALKILPVLFQFQQTKGRR